MPRRRRLPNVVRVCQPTKQTVFDCFARHGVTINEEEEWSLLEVLCSKGISTLDTLGGTSTFVRSEKHKLAHGLELIRRDLFKTDLDDGDDLHINGSYAIVTLCMQELKRNSERRRRALSNTSSGTHVPEESDDEQDRRPKRRCKYPVQPSDESNHERDPRYPRQRASIERNSSSRETIVLHKSDEEVERRPRRKHRLPIQSSDKSESEEGFKHPRKATHVPGRKSSAKSTYSLETAPSIEDQSKAKPKRKHRSPTPFEEDSEYPRTETRNPKTRSTTNGRHARETDLGIENESKSKRKRKSYIPYETESEEGTDFEPPQKLTRTPKQKHTSKNRYALQLNLNTKDEPKINRTHRSSTRPRTGYDHELERCSLRHESEANRPSVSGGSTRPNAIPTSFELCFQEEGSSAHPFLVSLAEICPFTELGTGIPSFERLLQVLEDEGFPSGSFTLSGDGGCGINVSVRTERGLRSQLQSFEKDTTGHTFCYYTIKRISDTTISVPVTPAAAIPADTPTAVPTTISADVPAAIPTVVPDAISATIPAATPTAVPTAIPADGPAAIPTAVPVAVPATIPAAVPAAIPAAVAAAIVSDSRAASGLDSSAQHVATDSGTGAAKNHRRNMPDARILPKTPPKIIDHRYMPDPRDIPQKSPKLPQDMPKTPPLPPVPSSGSSSRVPQNLPLPEPRSATSHLSRTSPQAPKQGPASHWKGFGSPPLSSFTQIKPRPNQIFKAPRLEQNLRTPVLPSPITLSRIPASRVPLSPILSPVLPSSVPPSFPWSVSRIPNTTESINIDIPGYRLRTDVSSQDYRDRFPRTTAKGEDEEIEEFMDLQLLPIYRIDPQQEAEEEARESPSPDRNLTAVERIIASRALSALNHFKDEEWMRDICPAIFTRDHTDPLGKLKVPGVQLTLFPHQIVGIWWCLKQQNTVFRSGVIGDEMGFGKSAQIAGFLELNAQLLQLHHSLQVGEGHIPNTDTDTDTETRAEVEKDTEMGKSTDTRTSTQILATCKVRESAGANWHSIQCPCESRALRRMKGVAGPTLITCPPSLLQNLDHELRKFADLRVARVAGTFAHWTNDDDRQLTAQDWKDLQARDENALRLNSRVVVLVSSFAAFTMLEGNNFSYLQPFRTKGERVAFLDKVNWYHIMGFNNQDALNSMFHPLRTKGGSRRVFKIPFARIIMDEAHRIIQAGSKNLTFLRFLDIPVWPVSGSAVNMVPEKWEGWRGLMETNRWKTDEIAKKYTADGFRELKKRFRAWQAELERSDKSDDDPTPLVATEWATFLQSFALRRCSKDTLWGKPLLDLPDHHVEDVEFEVLENHRIRACYSELSTRALEAITQTTSHATPTSAGQDGGRSLRQRSLWRTCRIASTIPAIFMLPELRQKSWLKEQVLGVIRGPVANDPFRRNLSKIITTSPKFRWLYNFVKGEGSFDSQGFLDSKDANQIGDKLLIFSTSPAILHCVDLCMDMWGLNVATAWSVSPEKRADLFLEFQGSDELRVLTGTYKTMSEGATLTRACTCIMMDPDWSIAAENQAKGRIHRVGQRRACKTYRLISVDAFDSKVIAAQRKGQELNATAFSKKAEPCDEKELLRTYEVLMRTHNECT